MVVQSEAVAEAFFTVAQSAEVAEAFCTSVQLEAQSFSALADLAELQDPAWAIGAVSNAAIPRAARTNRAFLRSVMSVSSSMPMWAMRRTR